MHDFIMHTCRCVSTLVKVREGTGVDPGFREGGLKIIFTMGEGTGGRAPLIGGLVRFFTFPSIYM